MIKKLGFYHNNLKNNFKSDTPKWYDNDRIYTLEDKSKKNKRYLKTGLLTAIALPLWGKYRYSSLSKSMDLSKAKFFFGLELFAILLPGAIYITANEVANYLHNKNSTTIERK